MNPFNKEVMKNLSFWKILLNWTQEWVYLGHNQKTVTFFISHYFEQEILDLGGHFEYILHLMITKMVTISNWNFVLSSFWTVSCIAALDCPSNIAYQSPQALKISLDGCIQESILRRSKYCYKSNISSHLL